MLKSKKILFVVGGSIVSGAEIVMLSVMEGLRDRGYQIHCVVNGWSDGDLITRLRDLGIPYDVIKLGFLYISKISWTLATLMHLPLALLQYWKIQNAFKPDISYHVCFRSIFMLFPFLNQDVIIFHVEDAIGINKVYKFFHYLIDKKVTHYIACSNFIKRHLQEFGINAGKISVIYNGVKIKNIHKLPSSDTRIRIGIAGQLQPHKGHDSLIEALRILKGRGKDFILKIYGKGDEGYIRKLKGKIIQYRLQNNVEWMGFIKEQSQIYSQLDIVVVPTISQEPFSLSAIEPAFFGLPVITSNKGGLIEIVLDNETGLIFDSGNTLDLSSKLESLIDDSGLRERLSFNARQHAQNKLTAEIMCGQIQGLLKAVCN